ncbi:hypothetical protein [Methylobacterium fujisawaense]|uniref:hypothetical protein n=1 Tax=Methylobacterium fujisawaense TaxID=107400 RepID=UPI00313F2533
MTFADHIADITNDQWTAVSAIASSASAFGTAAQALIAIFAAIFVGLQIRDARKSSDTQNLFAFYKMMTDAEQAFVTAGEGDEKEGRFCDLVNLLEVQAMALRGRIFIGVTKEAVTLKLIDACALIEMFEPWSGRLRSVAVTESSLKDLQRFIRKNRRKIDRVKSHLRMANTASGQAGAAAEAAVEIPAPLDPIPILDGGLSKTAGSEAPPARVTSLTPDG